MDSQSQVGRLAGDQLTVGDIESLEPGDIIKTGTVSDNPEGVNMNNSDKLLRYVAIRGQAPDWAIYIHLADFPVSFIARGGDKVISENNIRKLVPCTDEAYAKYRF